MVGKVGVWAGWMTKDRSPGGRRRVSGDRSGGRRDTWFVLKGGVMCMSPEFGWSRMKVRGRSVSYCCMTAKYMRLTHTVRKSFSPDVESIVDVGFIVGIVLCLL